MGNKNGNCAKNPTQKKTGLTGKSQGQIIQECQGQIPRSNGKMKWETTKNRKKPVLTGKIGKMGNGKNGKV